MFDDLYQFLRRWYKHSRFEGRNGKQGYPADYSKIVTQSTLDYLSDHGHAFISWHDSNTGVYIKFDKHLTILNPDEAPMEDGRSKGHLTHLF